MILNRPKLQVRKYVIASGYWNDKPGGYEHHATDGGTPMQRSELFHEHVWVPLLLRYAKPAKIIITDSASPVLPKPHPIETWLHLDKNYGGTWTTYPGCLRAFTTGCWYALMCDADLIMVEQDCLIVGKNWVDEIYSVAGRDGMVIGREFKGRKLPQPVEQSIMFVPNEILRLCINRHIDLWPDFPEAITQKSGIPLYALPFGYGRARPIDFKDPILYAQHWSEPELREMLAREGMSWPEK